VAIAYEEKLSQSPLVDFVFQSEDLTDGVYVASVDARWDTIFTKSEVADELDDADSKVNAINPGLHTVQA
jgi:hypothetical protein